MGQVKVICLLCEFSRFSGLNADFSCSPQTGLFELSGSRITLRCFVLPIALGTRLPLYGQLEHCPIVQIIFYSGIPKPAALAVISCQSAVISISQDPVSNLANGFSLAMAIMF